MGDNSILIILLICCGLPIILFMANKKPMLSQKQNRQSRKPKECYENGLQYFYSKNYNEAIIELKEALKAEPTTEQLQQIYCMLTYACFMCHSTYSQALKYYKEYLSFDNPVPELQEITKELDKIKIFLVDSHIYFKKKEYHKVIECFEKYVGLDVIRIKLQKDYFIYYEVAISYMSMGKYIEAIKYFEKYQHLRSKEDNLLATCCREELLICYIKTGDNENILKYLTEVKKCRSLDIELFLNILVADDINRINNDKVTETVLDCVLTNIQYLGLKKSIDKYLRIIEEFSSCKYNFLKFYEKLGYAYLKTRNNTKALNSLLTAIQLGCMNHRAYFELGILYIKKKNYLEALRCFEKIVRLVNDSHYYKGIMEVYVENQEETVNLKDIVNTNIKVIGLKYFDYYKARHHFDNNEREEAVNYFTKVINTQNSPVPLSDIYVLKSLISNNKSFFKAINDKNIMIALEQTNITVNKLACAYLFEKQYILPGYYNKDINKCNYNNKDEIYACGLLYFYLKNFNKAYDYLKRSLEITPNDKECKNLLTEIEELRRTIYRKEVNWWWKLNGWEFEQEVAKVFEENGYTTNVTKGSGDGGVDIILNKNEKISIVQCKHYHKPVPPEPIRALYGCKSDFNADEVILVASSGITEGGLEFVKNKDDFKVLTLEDIIVLAKQNKDNSQQVSSVATINLSKNIPMFNQLSSAIIDIETCSIQDLSRINVLPEEKIKQFIEKRNNGKMWHDIDSFAQEFELQPHEIILLQDKLKFPIKPKVKLGRKIDI